MTGRDTSPTLPDDSDFSFDAPPPSDSPDAKTGKREVPPLTLSPKEKCDADGHTPPGLSNPFWR
jgi:hypothetical protein